MSVSRLAQQMIGQQRDILRTFRQRRDFEVNHIQAIEEIFTKLAARHRFGQIAVGRGDNPHIDVYVTVAAERSDFAFLQHAQQLHL